MKTLTLIVMVAGLAAVASAQEYTPPPLWPQPVGPSSFQVPVYQAPIPQVPAFQPVPVYTPPPVYVPPMGSFVPPPTHFDPVPPPVVCRYTYDGRIFCY